MKTLYFDCFSGISGDMTIGALLDLGLDFDYLKTELKKLPVDGYELRASRVMRSNLSAMKFDVLMEGASENHKHEHHHGGHGHFHRNASEILSMIRESNLSGGAKQFAADIYPKERSTAYSRMTLSSMKSVPSIQLSTPSELPSVSMRSELTVFCVQRSM